ncbi:IclR family transcriptional regulator [Mycolicibacterium vaccae]|jgi:IclR family acetate operon transcriptional repressor|uniref:Glycerol operon regulatory protein n=1 Tax=Mycolicibacterium vaccae ATCC 25954 TaxID=1194972 RepID=K0UEL6_MYCVA|nr:IclR family transcriptional regulator [Mycolicibacterium vaccae]ANI37501.1 IclR family transcriptional regulator [Mycolicibacterium vaccae 95051]EJZ05732.1 IclR family transcriptional regulator [Mycolicibacterium vaccae ATCC 25954]
MPPTDDSGDPTFSPRSGIAAVDRAVAVLDVFTRGRLSLGVSDIARATGLSTSTAHRVLASLCAHGLVTKVGPNYALGPRILQLAASARDTGDVAAVARPVMTRLRDVTGETVGLHVVKGGGRYVIDQVESTQPLRRTYTEWGQFIPLHQGAPSRLLLAYCDETTVASVLAGPFESITPSTVVDRDTLMREIEVIRRDGYTFSFEERVAGIRSIAVPLRDFTGAVVAAMSVTGPAIRVTEEWMHRTLPTILAAAADISAALGYAGPDVAGPSSPAAV